MYTFHDYEEAYYHANYYDCQKIGLILLSSLTDKNSKRLYKKLLAIDIGSIDRKKLSDILVEVRIWLGVNL